MPELGTWPATALLAVLLGAWDAQRNGQPSALLRRGLAHAVTPWVIAVITGAVLAVVWGDLTTGGAYHDERAYVLQARIFASGAWTWPAPPVPEAWAMAHVFTEPAIIPKYPPGHALLLVPGLWLQHPALGPIVLGAAAAALMFVLFRTLGSPLVATLAWVWWLGRPVTLQWQASYFSETTTLVCWLLALNAGMRWRQAPSPGSVTVMLAALAWMGITRPVTAIALAIPLVGMVALHGPRRTSLAGWRQAVAVAVLISAIIPLWNWQTLGDWRELPYAAYSRIHMPFDMPGFSTARTLGATPLPDDLQALARATLANYAEHSLANVPLAFAERVEALLFAVFGTGWWLLALLVPLGAAALAGGAGLMLLLSCLAMLLAYLVMPHPPTWTVYYLELFPILTFLAVAGLERFWQFAARRWQRRAWLPWDAVVAALVVTLLSTLGTVVPATRATRQLLHARHVAFDRAVHGRADRRAVVFIRASRRVSPHYSVLDIPAPVAWSDLWIVRERDAAGNAEVLAAAGDRVAYVYDRATGALARTSPR